jgi:hypothetical protein
MDAYARSVDTIVSTVYDVFNRKMFSLPKLLILPGVIGRQPMLLVRVFPFIFLADVLKGRIATTVTDRIERFKKEAKDLETRRTKVEQFDMKNAELVSPPPPPTPVGVEYLRARRVSTVVRPSYRSNYLEFSPSLIFHGGGFRGGGGVDTASSIGKRRDRIHPTEVGTFDPGSSIEEGGGRPPGAHPGSLHVVRIISLFRDGHGLFWWRELPLISKD